MAAGAGAVEGQTQQPPARFARAGDCLQRAQAPSEDRCLPSLALPRVYAHPGAEERLTPTSVYGMADVRLETVPAPVSGGA